MVGYAKYESYKDVDLPWLDKIPYQWEIKPNKYLFCEKKNTVGKNSKNFTLLSLTLNGVIARNMENPQGKFPAEFNTYKQVKKNDLVFCLFDVEETPRTVGLAKQAGMITGAYTVVECRPEVNSNYISYYYLSLDFDKRLRPLYTGLRKVIQREAFMGMNTPLPPLEVQTRIANFLDQKTAEIDLAIAKKQRLIELLKEQKAILINQAVTQGLNPNAPMKQSGVVWIGEIPAHWGVKRLKYFSTVQSGITLGKVYTGKNLATFPYLRVANVQSGYFSLSDVAEITIPTRDKEKYLVRAGDILVTEGGDIDKLGRGTVWKGEIENCLHQNHIFAVRVNEEIGSSNFVSLAMESDYGRKYFTNTANKTTNLASTNSTKLGNFPVVVPSKREQSDIEEYCLSISRIFGEAEEKEALGIDRLQEFKQTLIAHAVTGKIKVPEVAKNRDKTV